MYIASMTRNQVNGRKLVDGLSRNSMTYLRLMTRRSFVARHVEEDGAAWGAWQKSLTKRTVTLNLPNKKVPPLTKSALNTVKNKK